MDTVPSSTTWQMSVIVNRYPKLLIGLLLAASAINVVVFIDLEQSAPDVWRAIDRHETRDITTSYLARTDDAAEAFWDASIALRRYTPGAWLVVPSEISLNHSLRREQLYGLAEVSGITTLDYGPDVVRWADIMAANVRYQGVLSSDDQWGAFSIVLEDGPADLLVLVGESQPDGSIEYSFVDGAFVDQSLLERVHR